MTNKEWLNKLAAEGRIGEWFEMEHSEWATIGCYEERLYGVTVSNCPYCGGDRIVIHRFDPAYMEPDEYRVEHVDEKDAVHRDCYEMYYGFRSIDDAVRHADMRNSY